ncbi:MAG: U32 family peptidase [Erysipelotrichaceae bacterium]|nr:U32 family peptidase [Erysipelotrichaceae bacterium]
MIRPELLAPAGSMEALKAAVCSGADAVYLGGIRFGARAFASNFNEENLIEAVKYCHLRQVKVYVTVNTLVYEHELEDLRNYLRFLYDVNVDAVIVQDFGVFQILKTEFPDFEIHCSTQMHIHNLAGVQFMKKMGAQRIVLARETPIELISECTKEGLEIEAFVHGALCVCYSGQCLFSSFHGGRSGNRGECAQPCRKKYQLINQDSHEIVETKGEYLLSPKDLWTIDHVEELIHAGISSFKIEGRMKRPEYVGEIVRVYRKAIDDVLLKRLSSVTDEDRQSVLKLFNRQMTTGHLFHQTGYDLMNPVRPNHIGIPLGKVLKVSKGRIKIELYHDLHQNDGIRILSKPEDMGLLAGKIVQHGRLVNQAKAGDIIELETSLKITCKAYDEVVLTTDRLQCESIAKQIQTELHFPVSMYFDAKINHHAELIMSDGVHTISVTSEELIQQAQRQPVSKEKIAAQLSKLNDTIYVLDHIEITGDVNIFFSLKMLNQMRREAVELMSQKRLEYKRTYINYPKSQINNIKQMNGILYEVVNEDQLTVFSENDSLFSSVIRNTKVHPKGKRVDEMSRTLPGLKKIHTQIGTLLSKKDENELWIADASFNVTNSYAIEFLLEQKVDGIIVSLEADDNEIESMIKGYYKRHQRTPNIGKVVYGRRELMIMKACLINAALGNGKKTHCTLCRNQHFALVDEKGKILPLRQDGECHPIIYESEILKESQFSDKISFIVVRFTDESNQKCKEIKKYYENIFRRI